MRIIGCDLSKSMSGLAGWDGKTSQPVVVSKPLGSKFTDLGTAFGRLHEQLSDLNCIIGGAHVIYCEEPLQPQAVTKQTTFETLLITYGLFAHAQSFAAAKGIRFIAVHQATWRRHFLGAMKRGKKSLELKEYAKERCGQIGISVKNGDEAEAVGVLDYACDREGIRPPWSANEVLRPPLGVCA
ncbi:hypothetical protein [Sphingopyxis sp. NJF-3]